MKRLKGEIKKRLDKIDKVYSRLQRKNGIYEVELYHADKIKAEIEPLYIALENSTNKDMIEAYFKLITGKINEIITLFPESYTRTI